MAMNRHIASKCRFNYINMLISRRDGGLLDKVQSFSTSTPHGVSMRCKLLFGENRSRCGVTACAFDDSHRNPSKGDGAPWHFYLSSATIHSDTRTTNATTRNNSKLRNTLEAKPWKKNGDRRGPSNENIANLKKKTQLLLNEDVSGKTKTTRKEIHGLMRSLRNVDQAWAVDASIQLLEKMWEWNKAGNTHLKPIRDTYNRSIAVFAQSTDSTLGEKAVIYLEKLENIHKKTDDPLMRPNTRNYNLCLESFKKVSTREEAIQAEKIVKRMQTIADDGIPDVKPNTRSMNCVISAWSSCAAKDGIERAENILEWMLSLYAAGHSHLKPNSMSFRLIMKAYALLGDADRVKTIIGRMEELSRSEEHTGLRPNTVSYDVLLNAYAHNLDKGSAEKADELLAFMGKMLHDRPTAYSYNAVMKCHANLGDAAKVESMISALEEKESLIPNTYSYNTLIEALAKSDEKDAPEKAEATLRKMQSLRERGVGDVIPTVFSFNLVLACYARDGNAHHAEAIVNHMEKIHLDTEFEHIRPDIETYNILIDAWMKSGDASGADKAKSIRVKIKELRSQG